MMGEPRGLDVLLEASTMAARNALITEIENAIVDRLVAMGLDGATAVSIIDALCVGDIPHVSIHPLLLQPWRV